MMGVLAVAAGAVGAVCRYLMTGLAQTTTGSDFPVGTLAVNLTGSFSLGLVAGTGSVDSPWTFALIGFLGGFTTFSTWMIETLRLGPMSARAALNLAVTLVGGLSAAALAYTLVQ